MVRPDDVAANLIRSNEGLWVAASQRSISYPEGGNEACFAIEDGSFWFQHRNAVIIGLVRQFPPPGTVFDVGGGNGYVAKGLCEAGFPAILVEPGPAGAENGRGRGLEVIRATFADAGFRPNALPAVGIFDVLEHIEEPHAFLTDLNTVIVPGGYLYVAVPAFEILWSVEDENAGHFRRYTKKTLSAALEAAGFRVRYASYMFSPLPPAIFLARSLPTRLKLRRGYQRDRARAEHAGSGAGGGILRRLLARERALLANGGTMPFGSSCIAVAQKGDIGARTDRE